MRTWNDKPYHSFDWEATRRFGKKLYRLSIDGGMNCPNRDGTIGTGGCIFCSEGGSGDFASDSGISVTEQLSQAMERIQGKLPKTKTCGFIAYFQAFTNTYGPVEYLEKIFTEAIRNEKVDALAIATRPDCLGPDVIRLLEKLNRIKPVWVELGLQTSDDRTAGLIRRGYATQCFTQAREVLFQAGISVVAHVILGLPGEGEKELLATISYLNRLKIEGIKLQLLHVLDGTLLADWYRQGLVTPLTFSEYEALLFMAIQNLRPDTVVHRITGDGPKKILLAPDWSRDKKRVMNGLHNDMKEQEIFQGKFFSE